MDNMQFNLQVRVHINMANNLNIKPSCLTADEKSRRSCELFNGDPALPVYQWTTTSQQYKVEELRKVLKISSVL